MADIKEILNIVGEANTDDCALIQKAADFAERAHEKQKRSSGEPYFVHVYGTAKNLANFGMDCKTIVAGFLHDVLEDTDTTEEQLEKEFGGEIVNMVKGVTKLGTVKYRGAERHVESLRKFFIAMADDIRILIIKLADRLHNIQTLQYIPRDKQKRIALETIEIHARLADRIGMGKLKGDLEDAAFPYVYPKEYGEVEKLLAEKSASNHTELLKVKAQLEEELKRQDVKALEISERVKHKYSLWRKLVRHKMDIENIHDIIALRVIVHTVEDCYRVLGIVHSLWRPLPGRIKDYISLPKPNGYRSLHTTVLTRSGAIIEIQIRTSEMHAEAAYGIAAHFIYKEGKILDSGEKKLEWIDQLKSLQSIVQNPSKFLEDLKMDFFKDRIFIFTPIGDVVDLPEDSSPIDFAYAIHSDVGDKANGAKINGKMSPLSTKLKNGDIVEIILKKDGTPSSKWLSYAKTALAKKHIKQYIDSKGGIINAILNKFK
jgi:GTP pyrophosphokinase